jgi:hypothetical protein
VLDAWSQAEAGRVNYTASFAAGPVGLDVVFEGVVGEVARAGVLAGADAVLDAGAAAVAQLQRGDVLAFLVGGSTVGSTRLDERRRGK